MALQVVVFSCLTYFLTFGSASKSLNNELFGGDYFFADLTYPFDNLTVYWPNSQNFEFTKKIEHTAENQYAANDFEAGEHGGTHIDAPYHFLMQGKHVGEIPLSKLIVPLIAIDVSSMVNGNPNFVLYMQHLNQILDPEDTDMNKPCLIIFKFGWSKYFNDREMYLGLNTATNTLKFPGLSNEVAEWIMSTFKNVVGVGVDVASVDPGSSTDFPVHRTFARAGLYNIENVKLTETIPNEGCTAFALPMKIAEGTGAPMRLVAVCPK